MCLACNKQYGAHGKLEIWKLLNPLGIDFSDRITIHTFDNKTIFPSKEEVKEIIDHALVVIATGIDCSIDIWAIQWPNEYKPKTFK